MRVRRLKLAVGTAAGTVLLWFIVPATAADDERQPVKTCDERSGQSCCPAEMTRRLSRRAVERTCKKAEKAYVRTAFVDGACRYEFDIPSDGESTSRRPAAFVEIRVTHQGDAPEQPDGTYFSWRKVGEVYMTYKAKVARAQAWFDAATTLWRESGDGATSVTVATALCSRAEAQKLAKVLRR